MMRAYRYRKVTSTQDVARKLLKKGKRNFIVIASMQTKGRGRRGRKWESPKGGIYFSFISSPSGKNFMKAGIAVAEVLREYGINSFLKWPNDVMVENKKIAGILIENFMGNAIIGIGINNKIAPVENSSYLAYYGINVDEMEIIKRVIHKFEKAGIEKYSSLCTTIGKYVKVEVDDIIIEGKAIGIDENGILLIDTGKETKRIAAGNCIHLR